MQRKEWLVCKLDFFARDTCMTHPYFKKNPDKMAGYREKNVRQMPL